MDHLTTQQRSENMARIGSKHTKPELVVRRVCFSMGYRYRLHGKHLPGKPDLVFSGKQKVIFVNGCFWHQHRGCRRSSLPSTRREFWQTKMAGNKRRDANNKRRLTRNGWNYLVLWECELKDLEKLKARIDDFLKMDADR